MNSVMHKKLSHLDENELSELLRRYYDPEKEYTVSQILRDFDIDALPGELVSLLPDTIYDQECPFCEGVKFRSKATSRSSNIPNSPECPSCGHKNSASCACKHCWQAVLDEREEISRSQRSAVLQFYGPESWHTIPDVYELSLEDMIYLKAIVAHNSSEDLYEVNPLARTQTAFAPGQTMVWDILKHLYHRSKSIAPCPESDLQAFDFKDDGSSPSFYMSKVDWLLLPSLSNTEKLNYLRTLDEQLVLYKSQGTMEVQEHALWHKIVKHEALEYYEYKLSEVNTGLDKVGDKTHAVFDDLVNRFSLAHIYHIIFVTVRNTHHYITQQRIPRYQAKNMYVGAIERNANKYEAEGWLKNFSRERNCPQTTLSAIFFDFYLGLGGGYFESRLPSLPEFDS